MGGYCRPFLLAYVLVEEADCGYSGGSGLEALC